MQSPVGYRGAPFHRLPVQIGVIGEAQAGPQVATDVLHPALHFPLRLGPIRLAQLEIKAQPQGEVQHPPVPLGTALRVPAQGHHLGVVIQAAPGHATQVVEGVDVALDEAGRVRSPDELHVDSPGPAEHHHEGPHLPLPPPFVHVAEAAPVHLCLLPGLRLEPHRGLNLATPAAWGHIGLHQGVAPLVPQTLQLPPQHHAVLQAFRKPPIHVLDVRVQLG